MTPTGNALTAAEIADAFIARPDRAEALELLKEPHDRLIIPAAATCFGRVLGELA